MARRCISRQRARSANSSHARSIAKPSASLVTGANWKPVATPSRTAASLASITVSARPPTRATTGSVP
jgi:hypothetical protein